MRRALRSLKKNASSAVPALPTVGSALDAALFRYLRPIPPGAAGLVTIPLDAPVLAHSRGRAFADVRVLDAAGRQVPYLVERASEPLVARSHDRASDDAAGVAAIGSRGSASIASACRSRDCPASRLVLDDVGARLHASGHDWRRARSRTGDGAIPGSRPSRRRTGRTPIRSRRRRRSRWRCGPSTVATCCVTVDEGDNSPLPLASARLLLPAYRLRLFRERDAALRLAYGRNDLAPPQYDLALLAPQLIGVAATEVVPGAEQACRVIGVEHADVAAHFWGVLIVAVLVLVALVVRLVRKVGRAVHARHVIP